MKKIFFYNGSTQFENMGDLLINKSMLDLVSVYGEIIVEDRNLPDYYKKALFDKSENLIPLSTITNRKFSFYILLVLLKSFFNKSIEIYCLSTPGHKLGLRPFKWISEEVVKLLIKELIYRFLECRFVSLGLTIDFNSMSNKQAKLWFFRSKYHSALGVRDSVSLQFAHNFHMKNVLYMPDFGWAFDVEKHCVKKNNEEEVEYIILSFRGEFIGKIIDNQYVDVLVPSVLRFVEIAGHKYKYILSFQVEFDREVCLILHSVLSEKYNVVILDRKMSLDELYNLYSNAKMVVSNRMHVLLYAILANTLPVGITDFSNHNKLRCFLYDNDLSDLAVDITENDFNKKVNNILFNDEFILNRNKEVAQANKYKLLSGVNTILK